MRQSRTVREDAELTHRLLELKKRGSKKAEIMAVLRITESRYQYLLANLEPADRWKYRKALKPQRQER